MSLYSRLDRLAADVEKLNKQVTAVSNQPQSQRTSVEGGSIDFNDEDGNLMAVVGGQDDGSNTIRHVDGPTPPIPSGLSAHVDGPIVQVSWDGSFETSITHDWHYLEVLAVGPSNEQLTGTINDLSGGETSLAATSQGDWFITARSVSRAGKRSLDGDAGTVAVQLVGLTGAIEAVQESANGKSTIYYSPTEPVAPDGGFSNGDLWFDTSEEGNNQASVWDGAGWVSMEDARLATIIAAQEELESDLTDVQTSVDGKNTITYDPDLPPTSYAGAVGDTWYRTSGNSMIGFWKWDGAAWVQQALSTTVIPQIDIGAGTFGSMSGSRLEVGSVTADKVLVGNGTNLIADGGFIAPFGASWQVASGTSDSWRIERPVSGTNYLVGKQVGSGWKSAASYPAVRVTAGQQYLVAADFRTPTIWPTGYPRIEVYVYDGDGVRIQAGSVVNAATNTTEWQSIAGSLTVPAGGVSMTFVAVLHSTTTPGSEVYVRNPTFRLKTGATLIENGAITTDKLAVGSITAESGVIASLDLGKATVGELDGIRIMGQTVRGEQLSGDAIDGKVITGGTIQSARDGQRWIGDPNGIRIINEDNDVRTQLSPDGSVFKGEVEADTLVVNEGAELKANNTLAQGAKLTLAAGVTDPTAPPMVQPYWDSLDFESPHDVPLVGLAFDGTGYWSASPTHQWPYDGGVAHAIRVDATTGEVQSFRPPSTNRTEFFGVTCIGSELFWLYRAGYSHKVLVTDLDCVKLREFPFEDAGHGYNNPLTYKPGIGNDGTNVVIAHCTDAGDLIFRTYNKATGAKISGVSTLENVASDITGVYVGAGDFGSNHMVAARASNNSFIRYTMSGNRIDAGGWFSPDRQDNTGIVYVDGKFRSLGPEGTITEYGDTRTGDESQHWWACYAWAEDFDGNGVTGTWSRPSPPKRFTWPRRAKLKILGQPLPDGAQMILPALAKKETAPERTDFHSPTWSYVEGKSEAHYDTLPTDWETRPSPRDSNNFPEAEPSTLEAANKQFQVNGDGSGRWGPLTFFANGSWSGAVVSGHVVIESPSANSTTSVEVTFPPGRFVNVPELTLTAYTSAPRDVSVGVRDVSATSFTVNMFSTSSGARRIAWIAFDQGA